MQKPNNYDNTTAAGEFIPVELGDHKLVIKQVRETQSKTGKPMAVVFFDFAPGDKQAGYFAESFKNDIRPDKKWSNQATQYILRDDADGNCSRNFKGFVTSVENSNPGFKVTWGDGFCDCLKGKLVGGTFGTEIDYYNGKELSKRVLRWFKSIDKLTDDPTSIPKEIYTKQWKEWQERQGDSQAGVDNDFMSMPDGLDEEIPFN